MKALWQNIQGVRRVVLETSIVSVFVMIVYLVVFGISGKVEVASAVVASAVVAAVVAAAFASVALASASAALASVVVAAVAVTAVAVTTVIAAAVVVAVVAEEYKIKYWKALTIFLIEAFALSGAMALAVPYLAVGVLSFSCITAAFLLAESNLRLWLSANEPPPPLFEEEQKTRGNGAYRSFSEVVRHPLPESFRLRLHRRLHRLYAD